MDLPSQPSQRSLKGAQRAGEEDREELASGTCLNGLLMLKAARNMEELGDATVWVVTPQDVQFQSVTECACLAMFCTMDQSCFRDYKCGEEKTTFGVPMKVMQQVVRATVADDTLSFSISSQLDNICFTMKPKEEHEPLAIMAASPSSSDDYQSDEEEKGDEEERQEHRRLAVQKRCGREAEFRMALMDIDDHKIVVCPERLSDDSGCSAIVSLSSRALHEIVRNISRAGDPFITIIIEPLREGDVKNRLKSKISFRTYSDAGPINGAQSLTFTGPPDGAPAAKKARTTDPPTRLVVSPQEALTTVANTTHFLRMARAAHRLMQEVRLKVIGQELILVSEMGLQGRFTSAMTTQVLESDPE